MGGLDYDLEVLDRPGLTLEPKDITELQSQLRKVGSTSFDPLPNYQVFETSKTALDDKIIAVAKRDGGEIFAFLSVVVLPISGLDDPVIHTGLTVVHPEYRQTGVKVSLFAVLFLHLLDLYPNGVWLSSLSRILTSLGQIASYTVDVFPSPVWTHEHPSGKPADVHLHIAREIDAKHREKMLIIPEACFDEEEFVFRAPWYPLVGPGCIDDVNDVRYRHRDPELSDFYRRLLRGAGDEVLQISFLHPVHSIQKGQNVFAKSTGGFCEACLHAGGRISSSVVSVGAKAL